MNRSVELEIEEQAYWQAIDRLLDQGGYTLGLIPDAAGHRLVLERRSQETTRTSYVNYQRAFRMAIDRVDVIADFRDTPLSRLDVRLSLSWEPRLQPIEVTLPFERLSSQDNEGHGLERPSRSRRQTRPIGRSHSQAEFTLALTRPPRSASRSNSSKRACKAVKSVV